MENKFDFWTDGRSKILPESEYNCFAAIGAQTNQYLNCMGHQGPILSLVIEGEKARLVGF